MESYFQAVQRGAERRCCDEPLKLKGSEKILTAREKHIRNKTFKMPNEKTFKLTSSKSGSGLIPSKKHQYQRTSSGNPDRKLLETRLGNRWVETQGAKFDLFQVS